MLKVSNSGLYKLRFRINKNLIPYFRRKEVNKNLHTKIYDVAKAKADILYHRYKEILKVSKLLEEYQIQDLVNKYIQQSLEQDLIDRATTGQGTIFTSNSNDNWDNTTPAVASANMCDYIKLDYYEALSKNDYSLIKNTVDNVLEENSIELDKNSKIYKLLSYYMMLAQINILDEASKRGRGNNPNPPIEISKKLFNTTNFKNLKTHTDKKETLTLQNALDKYIRYYTQEAKSNNTSQEQIKEVIDFLNNILINILEEKNDNVKDITQEDILDYRELLYSFPNRTRKPFNKMSIKQIIEEISNGNIDDSIKKISKNTINKYLSYTKSFFEYLKNSNLITNNPLSLISTGRSSGNIQEERLPLTKDEIQKLLHLSNDNEIIKNAIKVLYTSGMRLSELYKFKLNEINGVKVFDLRDTTIKLKTKSSYRIIPIHKSINLALLKELPSQQNLSHKINSLIREQISKDTRKVLYSLRHSFATDMKNKEVEPSVISELMGHSHETITLQRYAKSYDVRILKEAIEKLVI